MSTEKRHFFRINLARYLKCKMSITIIAEKVVNTEKTSALIENIGPGGLKILSDLMLPVNADVVFLFETKILGQDTELLGHIVWQKNLTPGIYQYGIKLITDEPARDALTKTLMKFAAKIRQGSFPYDDTFTSNYVQFFLEQKSTN